MSSRPRTFFVVFSPQEARLGRILQTALRSSGCQAVLLSGRRDLDAMGQRGEVAGHLIVLLSPQALQSAFVRATIRVFRSWEAPITAVLVKPLTEHAEFRIGHYVDATHQPAQQLKALAQQYAKTVPAARIHRLSWLTLVALGMMIPVAAALVLAAALSGSSPLRPGPAVGLSEGLTMLPGASPSEAGIAGAPFDPLPSRPAPSDTVEQTPETTVEATAEHTQAVLSGEDLPFTVQFSADPLDGFAPLAVTFLNNTIGNDLSFAWDFNGDGGVDSIERDPAPYTYDTPGSYRVTLLVTDASGTSDFYVEFIEVYAESEVEGQDGRVSAPDSAALEANFSAAPETGPAPLAVSFSNLSSGSIASYAWDFNGDGETDSTQRDPGTYTYTQSGDYPVRLRITGRGGRMDEHQVMVRVAPANKGSKPVAVYVTRPVSGPAPLPVTFSNLSYGDIAGYAWDFNGDGVVDSAAANPAPYVYQNSGTYMSSLRVLGPSGSAVYTQPITVGPPLSPVAAFGFSPASGPAPLVVTFSNRSVGSITAYEWDFDGDGGVDSTAASPGPVTYSQAGIYTATLVVAGPGGRSAPASAVIIVEAVEVVEPPVAVMTAQPSSGPAPLVVTFSSQSWGDIDIYEWDFDGDGVVDSAAASPGPVTYSQAGVYTATLVVAGPGGRSAPASAVIIVEAVEVVEPPVAVMTAQPVSGPAPLVVTFSSQSMGSITAYEWDFDGDRVVDSAAASPGPVTYSQAGVYTATLVVAGPGGRSAPASAVIIVEAVEVVEPPVAVMTAQPVSGPAPLVVTFSSQSMGSITAYEWDFDGDRVVDSAAASPGPVTYSQAGVYTATLVVAGPGGRSAPASAVIIVEAVEVVEPPVAVMTAQPVSGPAPLVVTFSSQSMGSITAYEWDFDGDGVVDSAAASPGPVTYSQAGVYTATLVVAGPGGRSAPASTVIIVEAVEVVEPPTEEPTPGDAAD